MVKRSKVYIGYLLVAGCIVLSSVIRLTSNPSGVLLWVNVLVLVVGVVGVAGFGVLTGKSWRRQA